ncbi:hypothetical protein [Desulfovibrio legallii]|jgi:hypothetical protein|uniref:GAF domain-containing protein n=1 Tax=Desulfovibrio legallii TaxID=571438 RepID=A0A1G7PC13_9BACT|nr:hypothetical protein [Desulfovibrio legallii]SDF83788.1 hypothetical protein SAMN05192586_11529 [Desulfovibrio legallii]
MEFIVSQHNPEYIREEIKRLLKYAPPEMRAAALALLPAAKRTLNTGYDPAVRGVPMRSWRCLLTLLASVASMQNDTEMLLRVSNDLLSIADRMAPPSEVLRQSAEILVHALYAEMYVCRLRTPNGEWVVSTANQVDGKSIPIVAPMLEEGLRKHPVMRAILEGHTRYVVSNNLHALDRGGESFDCIIYKEGYRSRLAFVLRERGNRPPFGLVMLYTKREYGFESFDERFLAKCASIVSLTVGRRVAVARDTLEKAAGAMAHYGNNALNVMRNQAEYCGELVEDIDANQARALRLAREVLAEFPEGSRGRGLALELESILARTDLTELAGHLGGVLEGTRRMTRIINSLMKSAERPRLMHYALGHDVLRLEDDNQ